MVGPLALEAVAKLGLLGRCPLGCRRGGSPGLLELGGHRPVCVLGLGPRLGRGVGPGSAEGAG